MAYIFHGYAPTTHRYVAGFKHLEEARYIGLFRVLRSGAVRYPDDEPYYGDSTEQHLTIKVPRGASRRDIAGAIRYQFLHGCTCEHDCCGHFSYGVADLWPTKRREWVVVVRGDRNC